ncbi:hypothetical protein GIY30_23725 [Gordonia sp. HNM0687]|uniref:Uncharacterized protein n=1 Tax=Gordonia mangrovi TaxID=2665643 RepID=A0A6L7GZJ9_9ACTN|nr:hypothetical protein [Gordonia mangrovi]MXP24335.1 hypothetical protein [Gordonia mangrovi]UVF80013.1 hypothetical protein NWF22_09400 [Gordonia mangrovi]
MAKVENAFKPSLAGLLFQNAGDTVLRVDSPGWAVDPDEGVDITEDEDEESVDPISEPLSPKTRIAPSIASAARAAWKKWDKKVRSQISGAEPPLPVEIRLLALRLHLDLLAAGLWGPSDEEWTTNLLDLICEVMTDEEDEVHLEKVESTRAALVANGFALLFDELKQVGGNEVDLAAQEMWAMAASAVAKAQEPDVSHHLLHPGRAYGRIATGTAVERLIQRAREAADDPWAETRALLAAEGLNAELRDGAWTADIGEKKSRRATAARIAEVAGAPCCVKVVSDHGACCVLWAGSDIAYGDSVTRLWKLFRIKVIGGPTSTIAGSDGLAGARRTYPIWSPKGEIAQIAKEMGMDDQLLSTFLAEFTT